MFDMTVMKDEEFRDKKTGFLVPFRDMAFVKFLPVDEQAALFIALYEFASGEKQTIETDGKSELYKTIVPGMQKRIIKDTEEYFNKCKTNKENAEKRWGKKHTADNLQDEDEDEDENGG